MSHDTFHWGPTGTETNPDYWNLETSEGQAAYDAYLERLKQWAEDTNNKNKKDDTPNANQIVDEITYDQYVAARGRYGTQWQNQEAMWQSQISYWSTAAANNFLFQYGDEDLYIRDGKGGYRKFDKASLAVMYAQIQADKVLSGELENPLSVVEEEINVKPYQLIVRVMSTQYDANGNPSTTPKDIPVQLTEDQYNLLLQSPIWGEYGIIDETKKRITTHVNNWWDLRELLKDPAKMGLDSVAVGDESDPNFDPTAVDAGLLTGILNAAQGMVESSSPLNPRDSGLPSIPAEYAKTGITWSIDPVTGTKELVDTMPWVGPPAGSLRWVPLNPADDPMGAGSWQVDRESQLSLQQTMWEGVPSAIRPWLQVVLNGGGDLNLINSALREKLRNALTAEEQAAAMANLSAEEQSQLTQHNTLRTWIGFILGQARASSDPEFGSPFIKDQFENWIPVGTGETAGYMKEFDQLLPNFLPSLTMGDAVLKDEKVTEKGLGKDKPPASNIKPKKDDDIVGGGDDDDDDTTTGPVGPDGDGGKATGESTRTVVSSHNNPDGTMTIVWSDGTTTIVGTPKTNTSTDIWEGDQAATIPITTVSGNTNQIFPGTQLPPHLVGQSAGMKKDTKPIVATEIGGDGVIGNVDSKKGDAFEGWSGSGTATGTGVTDDKIGTGEVGGGTGSSSDGSGTATGTVAAAIAAQKARDAAAEAARKAAEAEEERKRIEAAYGGGI